MQRITIILILLVHGFVLSQTPQGINYQTAFRDASGNSLSNQNIGLQFKILEGNMNGTAVYTETFARTTSAYGIVNVVIGSGTTTDDFSAINWSSGNYFLEISIDTEGGTSYAVYAVTQMLSVPYALHAGTVSVGSPSFSDSDNDTKIQVEKNTDDDKVRIDIAGSERVVFERSASGRTLIQLPNNDGNTFLGREAGTATTTGTSNVFFGYFSGTANTEGSDNTFFGQQSGNDNTTGSNNLLIGANAGSKNTTGNNNVGIGNDAGFRNTTGNENVSIGNKAGFSNLTGSNNVFVGNRAGENELGSNKLYIENSASSQPLIYGEFDNDLLTINGTLTSTGAINANGGIYLPSGIAPGNFIGTPGNFISFGDAGISEDYLGYQFNSFYFDDAPGGTEATPPSVYAQAFPTYSSRRWKHNIQPLTNAMAIINQLNGVRYTWNKDRGGYDDFGFIAEEVHQILPQIAPKNKNGDVDGIEYAKLTPYLVEAIKEQKQIIQEQQPIIERQEVIIEKIKRENEQLKALLTQLENRLTNLEKNDKK